LIRASLPRFGSSKGISTVVGTIFLVLTVLGIFSSIFLWTMTQNSLYNQAVKESYQKDVDRLNEKITASSANYTVPSEDSVQVYAELKNAGTISAQIITLWVLDATQHPPKYNVTDLRGQNINLNPGDNRTLMMTVTIPGANATGINAWVVTARGNTVAFEKPRVQHITVAELAQGIGSMALDFYKFRYFTYNITDPNKLVNYPTGISSFNVPFGKDIAFGVVLTNLDPTEQTIKLNLHSQLWVYFPSVPGQAVGPFWHIVNVKPDGTITAPYSQITLDPRETKLIVFASSVEGGFSKQRISQPQQDDKLCAVNLLLHGTIGTRDYGQNIPFVSLYVS